MVLLYCFLRKLNYFYGDFGYFSSQSDHVSYPLTPTTKPSKHTHTQPVHFVFPLLLHSSPHGGAAEQREMRFLRR